MSKAQSGDTVKVHYTGKLSDGTQFDTTQDSEPIQFTLGEGQVIPGFEDAIQGMTPGDEKTVEVEPEQGYGPRRADLIIQVTPDAIQGGTPEVGDRLQVQNQDGQTFSVTVTQINDDSISLDANHPLAGQDLMFDIELVEIV